MKYVHVTDALPVTVDLAAYLDRAAEQGAGLIALAPCMVKPPIVTQQNGGQPVPGWFLVFRKPVPDDNGDGDGFARLPMLGAGEFGPETE